MDPDICYPITWDILLAVESHLADWLCVMFESVLLSCADCLSAADLKSRVYYNRTAQLFEVEFAEGDLIYWWQRRQG